MKVQDTPTPIILPVSFSGSGDNILVPAPAGPSLIVRVWKLCIVFAGATNVIFKDGGGAALSGAMGIVQGGSITFQFDSMPWLFSQPGNGLILNSSNAVAVGGLLHYTVGGQAIPM